MAAVFAELKYRGLNCEMAPEYAKDKVWEESYHVLDNQIYVFAKQLHTIRRLIGKVDAIITDSPLLLSLHYGREESDAFKRLVIEMHHNMTRTLNIFLEREKDYNPSGRLQTEEEARNIDGVIRRIIDDNHVRYYVFPARREVVVPMADLIMGKVACGC
ncbi:MAG: hypothetical protein MN733_10490 [Nitrososphaera sp.]|nr:hypothetical protein [Nitrososphaera sp.]